MNFVLFYHSIASCWNHGNAHFLRGVARELLALGHSVTVFEPKDGWSRTNALADGGRAALVRGEALIPGALLKPYSPDGPDLDLALQGANVVIVHEWNEPELVAAIGRRRANGAPFTLLFHDTHHRAVTAPDEIERFDLSGYDGVLAFGEVLRETYLARGWGANVHTWHEAADVALFHPLPAIARVRDLVWVGNWGDNERAHELREFLVEPVARLGLSARIHGVRYPDAVRRELSEAGIDFAGWLPNDQAPAAFAAARMTVHVPRRPYVESLRGIPTIRVFEALACGIPLICSPWEDSEGLFPTDVFIRVRTGVEMAAAMRRILADQAYAQAMSSRGVDAIVARHTCAHRVRELLSIIAGLRGSSRQDDVALRPRMAVQ